MYLFIVCYITIICHQYLSNLRTAVAPVNAKVPPSSGHSTAACPDAKDVQVTLQVLTSPDTRAPSSPIHGCGLANGG